MRSSSRCHLHVNLNTNQSSIVATDAERDRKRRQVAIVEEESASSNYERGAGRSILSNPYQLAARSAQFRRRYGSSIGRTVQSAGFGSNRLGLNSVDIRHSAHSHTSIRQAIDTLGFERISEEDAATLTSERQHSKLTLAVSVARNIPALCGPSFLIMRPYVDPMHQLCSKWLLVLTMGRLEDRLRQVGRGFLTGSGRPFTHQEFTAFTVNLNNDRLEETLAAHPGVYLAKPTRGTMGQRQKLVTIRSDHVQSDLLQFLVSSEFVNMTRNRVILQRYVERPLLIDKRKFDMRVYYMIVNAKRPSQGRAGRAESGYFAFLHPGFVRLCSAPYNLGDKDLAVHLTNQSIQAKHTRTFAELKEVTTWYPDELNRYLNRRKRPGIGHDWARDVLYPKVGAILGYVSALYRAHLCDWDFPASTFRILGVDMLVDADLRVYLLEFNEFPAWGRQTSVLRDIKPNLWREAACLVSEVAIRFRNRQTVDATSLVSRQNFSLIYSSEDPDLARRSIAKLYGD